MVTLRGVCQTSVVETLDNLIDPQSGAEVKFVATEGGILIRQWQGNDGLYRTQHFLPLGAVIHTTSEEKLE